MDKESHVCEVNGIGYKMVIEKIINPVYYVESCTGDLIEMKNNQSAVTPTKLTFFEKVNGEDKNITDEINENLKKEIIQDYWEVNGFTDKE